MCAVVGTMTRHEFLAELHKLLRPQVYLEIGVQHGYSLVLSSPECHTVGVDPAPQLAVNVGNRIVIETTSDDFFTKSPELTLAGQIDMAFIDGQHLFEFAIRDFVNIEKLSCPNGVVVFDDVLPRNEQEASRVQCPGDWTGDVWRVYPHLKMQRPDLHLMLVDTQPTGTLVVTGLNPGEPNLMTLVMGPVEPPPVPEYILRRDHAFTPSTVLFELHRQRQKRQLT